ncbi:NAD-binding protein [Flindersiella endophytica]
MRARTHVWKLVVVAITATGAAVLGVLGFRACLPTLPAYENATLLDDFYYALQLFVLESGPPVSPGRYPVALQIARFLAPACTVLALVETVRALLSERLRRWAVAHAKGHIVIIGNDVIAQLLSRRFASDGERVVLICDTAGPDFARQHGVFVVSGDPTQEATLRSAGVPRAATVYVCGERSGTNVAVALTVRQLALETTTVEAEVRDAEMFAVLRSRLAGGTSGRIWLNFFVIEELAARSLLARESLVGAGEPDFSVAVLGSTPFGGAVVRQSHQQESRSGLVAVPDADVLGWQPPADAKRLRVYLCVDDFDLALRAALNLTHLDVDRIVLCLPEATAYERALAENGFAEMSRGRISVFGILDAACDAAPRDHLDELGRAIHSHYVATRRAAGETTASNPSLVPWSRLPQLARRSNRAQADDIGAKLARIDCAIVPAVDGGQPFAFGPGEVELLARLEHERWCAERRAAGFTYGPVRKGRYHPDLLGWDDVPDTTRQKNVDAVTYLPDLLAEAGYQILRLS